MSIKAEDAEPEELRVQRQAGIYRCNMFQNPNQSN